MNEVNTDNFNETMKGYIIRTCRIVEYDSEQLGKILNGLRWSVDEMTCEDARREYEKYKSGKIQFK